MANNLLAIPEIQFFDNNGSPLAGGSVSTYASDGLTLKTTYQDSTNNYPNTNPIVLDAGGRAKIWGTTQYVFVVKDSLGNSIYSAPTQVSNISALYAVDTGVVNALAVSVQGYPNLGNLTGVPLLVKVLVTNTGAVTLNVNSYGAISVLNSSQGPLNNGELVAGGIYQFVFDGANFQLSSRSDGGLFANMAVYTKTGSTQYVSVNGGTATTTNALVFIAPYTGIYKITVTGGGGGGSASLTGQAGSGGGAGGTAIGPVFLTQGQSVTVTVGQAGNGGTSSASSAGGTSSFGSFGSATGGFGGILSSVAASGGGGGVGAGLFLNLLGGYGDDGAVASNTKAGIGGASYFGGGGRTSQATGVAGTAPGSGGGSPYGGSVENGGNGATGIVIVEYGL